MLSEVVGLIVRFLTKGFPAVSKIAQNAVLIQLPYAQGASWDPNYTCLPGTCTGALSAINGWAHRIDSQRVFWVQGVAGSGKSAITHTIAQKLQSEGLLSSAFFFNRDIASRNTPQMLFTTIARDLARFHSGVAEDITAFLEKEPSLASSSLSRQFEAFILNPFRRRSQDHPILIVIDALDESIHDDLDTELLTILRDGAAKLPHYFRILITSRPMKSFQQFFSGSSHIITHSIDIHSIENRQDISMYVDAQMRDRVLCHAMGPGWQDDGTILLLQDLKKLAEGLFIWIVTVCSYLRTVYKPRAKLEALLSKSAPEGLPVEKKMDGLYITILAACGEWEDIDFLQDYQLIMGAIMAAKRPLSLAALRELHSSSRELSPEDLLQRFGSVLVGLSDPHAPIRMLHLSFREFITGRAAKEESTRKFYISEEVHSSRLAHLCIKVMNSELVPGNLSGTGYLKKQWVLEYSPGIPIVSGASEQLMYGCEHWINHVLDVDNTESILPPLLEFVSVHLTVWMEIVASRSVFRGSLAIRRWLQVSASHALNHDNPAHSEFLRNTLRSGNMCMTTRSRDLPYSHSQIVCHMQSVLRKRFSQFKRRSIYIERCQRRSRARSFPVFRHVSLAYPIVFRTLVGPRKHWRSYRRRCF